MKRDLNVARMQSRIAADNYNPGLHAGYGASRPQRRMIGDLCDTKPGTIDHSTKPTGTFRYIDISSVDSDQKAIVSASDVIAAEAPSRARKVVKASDIIVSMTRPNLNAVAKVPPDYDGSICSTGFAVLRPNEELLSDYLFQFVTSPRFVSELTSLVSGALFPAVSEKQVRSLAIPLPPLPEQHRIVAILNRARRIQRLRRDALAQARALIPALFVKLFGDPATNPMGWPFTPIGELTSLVTSGSTPRGGADVYTKEGPLFIRSQNVLMCSLDLSDAVHISDEIHSSMMRTKVAAGDVLLNITGASIGRVTSVPELRHEANVNQHVCIVRLRNELAEPNYLVHCLAIPWGQELINRVQVGASRQALNHEQVRGLKIPLPPIALQRQFATHVTRINTLIAHFDRQAREAEALMAALMARFFD